MYTNKDDSSCQSIRKIPTKYIENTFIYFNYLYNDKKLEFDSVLDFNSINTLLNFVLILFKTKRTFLIFI